MFVFDRSIVLVMRLYLKLIDLVFILGVECLTKGS